jgi:hypothetical protein
MQYDNNKQYANWLAFFMHQPEPHMPRLSVAATQQFPDK